MPELKFSYMNRSFFSANTVRYAFILLCVSFYSLPSFSWGQKGHRIIAQIAYEHLDACARTRVDKVLGEQGIVFFANWPDEIKSDTIYSNSHDWHYQDLNGGMSDSAVVATLTDYPAEGGNLFRALDSLVLMVADKRYAGDKEHADILKFIVHLSGDWYCPMHTAHLDDLGGNRVRMKWFGQNTNLHSVWDSKIIESQGYSYTEYADMLELRYGHMRKAIMQMDEAALLLHNYTLTDSIYTYHSTWSGNAYHYIYHWRESMEKQLYIAGIRLAMLLNELY